MATAFWGSAVANRVKLKLVVLRLSLKPQILSMLKPMLSVCFPRTLESLKIYCTVLVGAVTPDENVPVKPSPSPKAGNKGCDGLLTATPWIGCCSRNA